jgi:DNA-binding response OmpR family regulator
MNKGKILVIDDDTAILEAVQVFLDSEGYAIKTSTDGLIVLEEPLTYMPDLILLDLLLSGKDGRKVVQQLRHQPQTKDIPVIIMSAHTVRAEDALMAGAQEFLPKPFDIDVLIKLVQKYLPKRPATAVA